MLHDPLRRAVAERGLVVLDGGLATALEDDGHTLDTALWSARLLLDAPDAIAAVHERYLEAGADCITTASYQASLEGLGAAGLNARDAEALLLGSVELAIRARDEVWARIGGSGSRMRPLVAASVGPYGAYLADGSEYDGRYGVGRQRLVDFHGRRFELLATSEADLLACETVPSALEAEVLLELLEASPGARAWLTFSCRDERHISDGTPLRAVVEACVGRPGVVGVGVNCTAPRFVPALLDSILDIAAAASVPVVLYPNSGESYDPLAKRWRGDADEAAWLTAAAGWIEQGARVVGGCCRVGPAAIAGLRVLADRARSEAGPGPPRT